MLDPLPPLVPPGGRTAPASPASAVETVPAEVARAFRSVHGFDVSTVRVHRGPATADQARALGARAFTVGGDIYLPGQVGSAAQGRTRALLAHELTHAAQQQLLGPALPAETSGAGQALEDQATATERWFLGEPVLVPPLSHLPADGARSHDGVQRQPAGSVVASQPSQASVPMEPELTGPGAGSARLQAASDAPVQPAAGAQAFSNSTAALPAGAEPAYDPAPELAELREQLTELAQTSAEALSDPAALDDLAGKLYQRLRSRLRLELIVDRERAGILTDFR
jgi:hypothetical protein